jgi:hypothetical protein
MLLIGSFWGRAGGLIVVGLIASLATAIGVASEKYDGDQITDTPLTADAVQASYDFETGEYVLDLTRVSDVAKLDGRNVTVSGQVGELEVRVPEGVDVDANGQIDGPGGITLFGDTTGGIDTQSMRSYDGGPDAPELGLDLNLEVGHIQVSIVPTEESR